MKKKKTALILVVLAMAMMLTACGKFTCDICGKEKSGKSYKADVFGQEVVICKDCHEDLEEVGNLFK